MALYYNQFFIAEKIAHIHLQQQQQQPEPKAQQPKAPTPNQMVQMHQSPLAPPSHNIMRPPSTERIPERVDRIKQEIEEPPPQYVRDLREPPPPPLSQENKVWGYSGLDLINSGASFWQNYSGKRVKKSSRVRPWPKKYMSCVQSNKAQGGVQKKSGT